MAKIRVALRLRPLSEREEKGGFPVVVAVEDNSAFITDIRVPERPKADSRARYRQFTFDHAFWLDDDASEGAGQSEIYREIGPPLEKSIMQGYNACLLAYGQSGTGKSFSMLGSKGEPGIIPRLCHSLWDKLKVEQEGIRMEVSFMEIYREKVRDLLKSPSSPLKLREHPQYGPHVQDLSRVGVTGEMGLLDLLWEGESRRAIGATGSNRRSSRSHAIWTIYLTSKSGITNQVHLVDLAGSEKAGFTTAKNLLAEGADINRSLVALGNVISSLAEKAQYIPYRDSALTWLLKDSLGGNATTAIIITASPASCCHAQTLNSFRFAERARQVENSPRVNFVSSVPSGGSTTTTSSALYSIMSAFEIKKDISRLSRLIRSAQSNGGILRGLAPRANWSRLVTALEGWNQIESEQVKLQQQRERSMSEDVTAAEKESSAVKSDAMNQADFSSNDSPSTSMSSASQTPTHKIKSTEVFIPSSSSIKCLTWQAEETHAAPIVKKEPSPEDDDVYGSFKMTPPHTPTTSLKVHHMKYILPVQFPVQHHLDHAGRISEKVHRVLSRDEYKPDKASASDVPSPYLQTVFCSGDSASGDDPTRSKDNYVFIRDRIPTHVCTKEVSPVFRTFSEKHVFHSEKPRAQVPLRCKSVEEFIVSNDLTNPGQGQEDVITSSESSTTLEEFYMPAKSHLDNLGFESVDSEEVSEDDMTGVSQHISKGSKSRRYRMVRSNLTKVGNVSLKSQCPSAFRMQDQSHRHRQIYENLQEDNNISDEVLDNSQVDSKFRSVPQAEQTQSEDVFDNEEDETLFFSNSTPIHTQVGFRTRNYFTDKNNCKRPSLVQVIPEESESEDYFMEESLEDIEDPFESKSVNVVCIDVEQAELVSEEELEEREDEVCSSISDNQISGGAVIDSATDCKFRNHFAREYYEIDKIGKKLKQLRELQQMTERFAIVKPFLEQIEALDHVQHTLPDDKLDTEIESCCGWNVDIEFQKVNSELNSLSKLLLTGIVPPAVTSQRRDSSTSTATTGTGASSQSSVIPPSSPSSDRPMSNKSLNGSSITSGNPRRRNQQGQGGSNQYFQVSGRPSISAIANPSHSHDSYDYHHHQYHEASATPFGDAGHWSTNPSQRSSQPFQGFSVHPLLHQSGNNQVGVAHPHHHYQSYHHHPRIPEEPHPVSSWEQSRQTRMNDMSSSYSLSSWAKGSSSSHRDLEGLSSCSSLNPLPTPYYATPSVSSQSLSQQRQTFSDICSCQDTTLSAYESTPPPRRVPTTTSSSHFFSSPAPKSTSSNESRGNTSSSSQNVRHLYGRSGNTNYRNNFK